MAMHSPGKKKVEIGLDEIPGMSTFQRKCEVHRDSFFPANIAHPAPMPPGFLPLRAIDLSDMYKEVTAAEITSLLSTLANSSSPGTDEIAYPMIQQVPMAHARLLPEIFNGLLHNGFFP